MIDKIRLGQIKASPAFTYRKAAAITSAFDPVSSTWTSLGSYVQTGLIDKDFVSSRVVFNSQSTDGYLESGGTSGDTRVDLPSSQFWLVGTGSTVTTTLTHAASFQAPYFAIGAYVAQGFGDGSSRTFQIRYGDASTFYYLEWDQAAGTVAIKKFSGSASLLASASISLTGPFEIALCLANLALSVQVKYPTGEWFTVVAYDIPTSDSLDPRQPARLAAANRVGLSWTTNSSSGTFKLGTVAMGYLNGINGLADQPFNFSDGTPIQKGAEQFVIFSNSHVSASANTAIPTANFDIKAVNPTTCQVRTQAKVFMNNTETGITGGNSGCGVYHPDTDKCYWVIPNYGDQSIIPGLGGSSANLKMYLYTTSGFPSGIVILQNPVAIVLPQTATNGIGDPCLRWNLNGNGLWNLTYAVYLAGYAGFGPTYCTIPSLASVGTAGNWTQVASVTPTSGMTIEGIKFMKFGSTWRIVSATNATTQTVYDLTLTSLGTITTPPGGPATPAHFCCLVYPEGNGNQRYYWLYFDKTEYGFSNYTHGRTRFAKSTFLQLGQSFDQRILMDV